MLAVNKQYRIRSFNNKICKQYRHRLLAMGMLPGATFSVIRYAPLGETVQIEINDVLLSLRNKELAYLEMEEVSL